MVTWLPEGNPVWQIIHRASLEISAAPMASDGLPDGWHPMALRWRVAQQVGTSTRWNSTIAMATSWWLLGRSRSR